MLQVNAVALFLLASALLVRVSATLPYDPWDDINDDGKIDIKDIADVAARFGTSGTPLTKAYLAYDSGWISIADKAGKYFSVVHNLNSTDIMVDIVGKSQLGGGIQQRNLGGVFYSKGRSMVHGLSGDDYGVSVVRTSDGGIAIAGGTYSSGAGGSDFWLVKVDSTGIVQWNTTYGGANHDTAWAAIQTSDMGFAIAGYTTSFGAVNSDWWLVKTDSTGNIQWNATYSSVGSDTANSLIQTDDGGYVVAGDIGAYGGNDAYLIKFNSTGVIEWTRNHGVGTHDGAYSVVQTSDGGYAVAGYRERYLVGPIDFWLLKTDSNGIKEWDKTFGGASWDVAYSVAQTMDGGYAVAGETSSFGAGAYDYWIVKTNSTGNPEWNQTYGRADADNARALIQTGDGGFTLVGYTRSFGTGDYDLWIVETGIESGLTWTNSTANSITLYRGSTDAYWNYIQVRIWKIK